MRHTSILHVVGQRFFKRLVVLFAQKLLHQRQQKLPNHLFIQLVFPVKAFGMAVIFHKRVVSVHRIYRMVVYAEESVAKLFVLGRNSVKLFALHLVEMSDGVVRHPELLFAVLSSVQPLVYARMHHLAHR